MTDTFAFENGPLDDMVAVGSVEADKVRLWIRSGRPGRLRVSWWPQEAGSGRGEATIHLPAENDRDNTCSVLLPAHGEALPPLTRYGFRVLHTEDGRLVGEGSFETAPAKPEDTPHRFGVALMSCHQPYDETGSVKDSAREMLRAARRCLHEHDVKLVLMVGDQIYADYPPALSLFNPAYFETVGPQGRASILDCSPEEVRRLYQQRYRYFWNVPELQAIQAEFPCYMILDDHDIVNNWGSNPAHQTLPWSAIGEGALRAYHDYQASRIRPFADGLPEEFHYRFAYGHTAGFVMDVRSGRRAGENARLVSESQINDLKRFLETHGDKEVVLIVTSVPIIHVPRRLARVGARLPAWGEDFSDRWSSESHVRDRDRVVAIIHAHQRAHPHQHVLLLSGDIHMGCVHRMQWRSGAPDLYQMISSPITHETPRWVRYASKLLIRLKRSLTTQDRSLHGRISLLPGTETCRTNLYGGLNVGIVEIERATPGIRSVIRLLLYGHRGPEPVCVYRSPAI